MRRCRLFSAVLATAAGSLLFCCMVPAGAQKIPKRCLPHPAATETHAPKVFIDQVTFDKTEFPNGVNQAQLVESLKEHARNAGSEWLPTVRRTVKEAWQDAGYFQAVPTVRPQVTHGAGGRHIALTIHVDPGPRYRLSRIRIRAVNPGGKLAFSEETLRNLIPLSYAENLNMGKIREGLHAIQEYYGTRGYIDMTGMPGFHLHAKTDTVSFYVFVDEGKQYRVGRMTILGLDPSLESLLKSKLSPGDIFNWDLVLDFYKSQQAVLPPDASPQDDEVYRVPKTDKVDVWLDFRACPAPAQPKSPSSASLH